MIIIWGSVETEDQYRDALLHVCRTHVARSRSEPGCISHGAYVDTEDANRIVFFERWEDDDSVRQHFREPASQRFVAELRQYARSEPSLEMFAATPLPQR